MRALRILLLLFAGFPAFCQQPGKVEPPQSGQTPAEASKGGNRTALDVTPAEKTIKNSDLFEGTGYWHPLLRLPRFVLHDQKAIWTSPFHTSRSDAKYWAMYGGATALLVAFDERIQKNAPNPDWLATLGTRGSYLGASYTLIPISAGFYLLGSKTRNERFREAGLMAFEALIDSTIVEEVLKVATARERPLEGNGQGRFFRSPNRLNASFPSGHSTNTFALASIFAHVYHDKWWVKVLVYGYAGAVAGARLSANRHFPSDTLAGGAIGWFIGDYIYGKRHNPALNKPAFARKLLDHVHFGFTMQ